MSLLRFCYAGRQKKLAFTSSITSCLGPGGNSPTIFEAPVGNEPSAALSTGYAQSKYISKFRVASSCLHIHMANCSQPFLYKTVERITKTASLPNTLQIPIRILRVGQLCGSIRTGLWSTAEMYPILFATSFHPRMHCIPTFTSRSVDWVPIDVAAHCISELLFQEESTKRKTKGKQKQTQESKDLEDGGSVYTVHNIVNPHPISWPSLLSILQSSIKCGPIEEVPISEWVRRLNSLVDEGLTATDLPGLRLLGFFERLAEDEGEGGGRERIFETGKTREMSHSLRDCGPVCKEWIQSMLDVWRRNGFIDV